VIHEFHTSNEIGYKQIGKYGIVFPITIPTGCYEIESINKYIKKNTGTRTRFI
jgi:hypothetical protein